jgi:hypothetical protein
MYIYNEASIHSKYEEVEAVKNQLLEHLESIVKRSGVPFEGNCFYEDGSFNLKSQLLNKQLNLFWTGKQASMHICEIGFNAGHSCMLFLLGKEQEMFTEDNISTINITIFDIMNHSYTKPCFDFIKSKFENNFNLELIEGDSIVTIPEWMNNNTSLIGKFDICHLDGGHDHSCVDNDFKNANLLLKVNGILIVDDTNGDYINNMAEIYISSGNYIEIDVLKTDYYPHRILQKVK